MILIIFYLFLTFIKKIIANDHGLEVELKLGSNLPYKWTSSRRLVVPQCKKGQPCSYLGKELGWQIYEERASYNLTYPPVNPDQWKDPKTTIYLTISSFRDKLCPITLKNAFTKATHPSRVFIGIVQQNTEIDVDCKDHYCVLMKEEYIKKNPNSDLTSWKCPYEDNIRMTRVHAKEAKGPTWARAKGIHMLKDENFCMQTDAHMDFLPHWDVYMMRTWTEARNEYAVLSTYVYPLEMYDPNLDGRGGINGVYETPNLCMITFQGTAGLVRNWGSKCMRNMPRPKITNAIWGAGLSFSKCHAERKVPYDPHTPNVFDGEEFSRALRFWTWGYDIYSPHRVYVLHDYTVSQADPVHFDWVGNTQHLETAAAEFRLKTLFQMPDGSQDPKEVLKLHQSRYGLGDRRTLDQAIQFSGIDTKNRKILGNRCGNIDFIPFQQHPWGPEYVPKYNITTEEFIDARDPGSIYFDNNNDDMIKNWNEANQLRELEILKKKYNNEKIAEKYQIKNEINNFINKQWSKGEEISKDFAIELQKKIEDYNKKHYLEPEDKSKLYILFCCFIIIFIYWCNMNNCNKYIQRALQIQHNDSAKYI